MPNPPKIVYKYESFNIRSLMNLKEQSLYFGSPRGFNDPYDCAITASVDEPTDEQIEIVKNHFLSDQPIPSEYKKLLETLPIDQLRQHLKNAANTSMHNVREEFLSKKGVTCFSELNDDLVMWAHYGGQYKGYCLAFDTDKEPFTKLRQVQYVKEIPQIDIVGFMVKKEHDKILDKLFCTKSISWAYEREWRALHNVAGTSFHYASDALKAIYFGPEIENAALEIICLIIQGQNPDVQFFKGRRSETGFKVEFEGFHYTSHIEAIKKGLVPS